jgi:Na+/proline symporter
MTPSLILIVFATYTLLLFLLAYITGRGADNDSFFVGNRKSPWFVVAYGMIGASLSGVTFISIPGWVGTTHFTYFVIVSGYFVGYIVVSWVLLPIYYKLRLTSIYTYLDNRFGSYSYHTGAVFFLISRIIGASFRMFLVVSVLQLFVFDYFGIPFWVTLLFFILLIQLYTMKGGIKTIVWTDTLQTTFMLLSVVVTIWLILSKMNTGLGDMINSVLNSNYSEVIVTDIKSSRNFIKLFLSGIFITITMTGLDQDMMQKNLSCKTLPDAKKNMVSLGFILIPVNIVFLFLGAVLYIFAAHQNIQIPVKTDYLFPEIALNHLGIAGGVIFIIGLISAAYSSADSALTALTTSFSIDILHLDKKYKGNEHLLKRKRQAVHVTMSVIIIFVILLFKIINDDAVISALFTFAGYTYGPLLGMYSFGLFTRWKVKDKLVPWVASGSPFLAYGIRKLFELLFDGYKTGFELI